MTRTACQAEGSLQTTTASGYSSATSPHCRERCSVARLSWTPFPGSALLRTGLTIALAIASAIAPGHSAEPEVLTLCNTSSLLYQRKNHRRQLHATRPFTLFSRTASVASVRRSKIRKFGEQILVRSYPIPRHFPICDYSQEGIGRVVAGFPAIVRVGRRARGIIEQEVGEQWLRHLPCFIGCEPSNMLQRVSEDANETGVVRRFRSTIRFVLFAGEEGRLRGSCTSLGLHPPRSVYRNQRASPQAHLFLSQSRVGHFQRYAANVLVAEEIHARPLKIVFGTTVEEEGITTPASKEAIIARLRHLRVPSHRDGRSLDDDPPAIPRLGGLVALQETQGCGLRPILQRREAHLVRNIGD